jgi:acyl-CoA synthetase (AMP-forming)/AMP-acid ligase II
MNLSLTLQTIARSAGDRSAITCEGSVLDYAAFEDRVARIAGSLARRHGLGQGARVGIVMENCAEFLPALYGVWRAGATAVPINAKLHPKELAWILGDSEARLVLATPDLADKLSSPAGAQGLPIVVTGSSDWRSLVAGNPVTRAPAEPEDEAWLFYTSGTTGRPKGAVLTHRNLLFMCHCYYADIDPVGTGDTMVHAAPLSHGAGLYALAHIAKGSNQAILPGSFDPDRILDTFARFGDVSMFAAPTMVARLLNHPRTGAADTRGLKCIAYGGAPMYVADLKRGLDMLGPKLYQLYGQGESPMTITGLSKAMHAEAHRRGDDARLGSAGIARTGVAFRIVAEDGGELPPGEVGEVVTKSDCVMRGYWNNPEANARSLRDGWLWTGDLGSVDAAGVLTLKDRSKDLIISGGANIYPREVEEVLLTHHGVLECAVVSRPHPEWGEEVVAFVVKRPDADRNAPVDARALDQLCLDNIARFKRPKEYLFVEGLPKNNYGKILKSELRERLRRGKTD